jgi:hypothetical protein
MFATRQSREETTGQLYHIVLQKSNQKGGTLTNNTETWYMVRENKPLAETWRKLGEKIAKLGELMDNEDDICGQGVTDWHTTSRRLWETFENLTFETLSHIMAEPFKKETGGDCNDNDIRG